MSQTNATSTGRFNDLEAKARILFAKFEELKGFLDLASRRKELEALTLELSDPAVWQDQKKSMGLQQGKKSNISPASMAKRKTSTPCWSWLKRANPSTRTSRRVWPTSPRVWRKPSSRPCSPKPTTPATPS
jgi:hypothetical protein